YWRKPAGRRARFDRQTRTDSPDRRSDACPSTPWRDRSPPAGSAPAASGRAPCGHDLGDDLAGGADGYGVQFDFGKFFLERIPDHLQIAHRVGRINRDFALLLRRLDDVLPARLRRERALSKEQARQQDGTESANGMRPTRPILHSVSISLPNPRRL